jgi:LytR cell envelope-related transcriptional attenuator
VSVPRTRDERGVVFPSPVVMLSIIAIAMAGIAYVATQGQEPTQREITTTVAQPSAKATPKPATPSPTLAAHEPKKIKKRKPAVQRGEVYVEVYNNSGITGLAGSTAEQASGAGWQVVATDNWYGTIPASTVYYPERLKAAAKVLALDLGIGRVMPAIEPMDLDRLTVILTADAA